MKGKAMSYYVTFRSLNATVRSLQAVGQISKVCADAVVEIGQQMRIGKSWESIKPEIQEVMDPISQEFVGEYLIGQIEDDAATSDNRAKFEVI